MANSQDMFRVFKAIAALPVWETPFLLVIDCVSIAVTTVLALLGFLIWNDLRRRGILRAPTTPAISPAPDAPARQET